MKVRLNKRAKVWQEAGAIVEVTPEEADFLVQVCGAELLADKEPAPKTGKPAEKPEAEKAPQKKASK